MPISIALLADKIDAVQASLLKLPKDAPSRFDLYYLESLLNNLTDKISDKVDTLSEKADSLSDNIDQLYESIDDLTRAIEKLSERMPEGAE